MMQRGESVGLPRQQRAQTEMVHLEGVLGILDYIYGPTDEPVEQVNLSSSTPTYLTYTSSDSSWLATNNAGQQVAFWRYDAFGNLAYGTPDSPFGYSGQYTDASTGFSNLRARFYEPETGGFTTRDPAFGSTDTAYTYAAGDPVNGTDPSGLCLNKKGIETHIPCTPQQLAAIYDAQAQAEAAGAAQGCSNFFSCAVSDPGSIVSSFNSNRGQIAVNVGVVLGVAAAATGVGAIVEGAAGAGFLLGAGSLALGAGAAGLDYGPCVNGDNAACVGLGLGATGAFAGAFGAAGAGLVVGGIIAEDSLAASILGGIGAFGWNVGIAGTIFDAMTGIASAGSLCNTKW
jgi:RHS repeat-associated protein